MRDERREAVAEIVQAALDFNMLVNTILAWHDAECERAVADRARLWKQLTDAEMRAAQDELAELTAEGERLVMALNAKDAETRALREAGLQFVAEIMPRYREVFEAANLGVFLDSIGNQEARKFLALLTPTPGAGEEAK